jgi:hypothetical protein
VRNPSSSNQSPRRRGRITAALAAGVVTVVVGSIGTASADAPEGRTVRARTVSVVEAPEGSNFRVNEPEGASFRVQDTFGSGGGGRATFR